MRSSWLYLAVRSLRATEPVLIWPAFTATARSATTVSSVSLERCEITVPEPARFARASASHAVAAVVLRELAGGDVEGERDVVAGTIAGALDGLHEEVQRGGVAAERRREAALVPQPGPELLFLQRLLERVEDFHRHAQGVAERVGAGGHQHEFLEVDPV